MADIPKIEDILAQTHAYEKLQELANSISFSKVEASLRGFSSALQATVKDTDNLRKNTLESAKAFDTVAKSISTVMTLTTKFDAFKQLQVQGGSAIQTMGDQFDEFIGRFDTWDQAAKKLAGSGLTQVANMTEEGARKFFAHVGSAQKLENAYIGISAASGQLNEIFDSSGNIVSNLSAKVAQYSSLLTDTSAITHENIATVSNFAAQLGKIPNVLGTMVDAGKGPDDQLDGLAATMTIAKGSGRDLSEVLSTMTKAYENLSKANGPVKDNAKAGIEMFALMSKASKDLGLQFDDTQGYLTHVADQFKMVGNNTEAATNILSRFSGALQNTGLTAKQSVQIVQGMVDSIKNLEMGTKALISVRSGGPGGLQGAFKIENMLREGKMDEVAKMLERSFKQQVGGRIVTQKEAEQSPQAAAQFMRQRELLKSGAFGGLAKDNESATRLLEAIAKGPLETANALSAKDATKSVVEQGNKLQEQQVNLLDMLNNSMDRSVAIEEQILLASARDMIGGRDKTGSAAPNLDKFRNTSRRDVISQYGSPSLEPLSVDRIQQRQNRIAGADFIDGAKGSTQIFNVAKEGFNNARASFKTALDDLAKEGKLNQDKQIVLRGQNDTQRATVRAQNETLRQRPPTLAPEIPKAAQVVKHEVDVKPLEVNINVSRDKDMQVTTTTNYKTANVRDVVSSSTKGYTEQAK